MSEDLALVIRSAACRDSDPEIFFNARNPQAALDVCARCTVTDACLRLALKAEASSGYWRSFGIFGGLRPHQRDLLRAGNSTEKPIRPRRTREELAVVEQTTARYALILNDAGHRHNGSWHRLGQLPDGVEPLQLTHCGQVLDRSPEHLHAVAEGRMTLRDAQRATGLLPPLVALRHAN